MIKIGITGGIGSGKSRVCALFAALGVPVYDSDNRGKELMNGSGEVKEAVTRLLGVEAYNGEILNRAVVADKVFSDKMLLTALNRIVHPALALDFNAWTISHSGFTYVVMESAILFESGFDRFVDKVIAVSASQEIRLQRVTQRDGVSKQSVMNRIANQLGDDEREARADYIIRNDGTLEELAAQVKKLDKIFKI